MKWLSTLLNSQPFIAVFLAIGLGYAAGNIHDFYPGGRHGMLHELNRREVFTNLLVWISGILETAS